MKIYLRKTGGAPIDISKLTAGSGDVAAPEKFYGAGFDSVQAGALKKNDAVVKKLGANESYTVPSGIIPAESYVYQEIPTQGAITISPVAAGSFVGVLNKYMTEDIVVNGVPNLVSENIRAGATIGTVSGSWQGYVNNDELCPYWYGIFAPGQSGQVTLFRSGSSGVGGNYTVDWNAIPYGFDDKHGISARYTSWYANSGSGYGFYALTFNQPIDMTGVKSITFLYQTSNLYANERNQVVICQNKATPYKSDWSINPDIGAYEVFNFAPSENKWSEVTIPISSAGRYQYIYFGIGIAPTSSTGRGMSIVRIKLNK